MGVEMPGPNRDALLASQRYQVARTFMNLLGHISKDQTIQYILTLVDDILSVSKLKFCLFQFRDGMSEGHFIWVQQVY